MCSRRSRRHEFRQVVQLLRSIADRRILLHGIVTVLTVIVGGAVAALTPLALKSLVDAASLLTANGSVAPGPATLSAGIAYLILLLAGRVLADLRPLLNGSINQRLHSRLAQRFFDHVLRLPMDVLLARKSGELLHSLDLASAGVQLVSTHLVGSLLPVLVELFTMGTVLVHLHQPALVAVFGIASLVYLAIFSVGARSMTQAAQDVSASSLDTYAHLNEGLAHFETLRYFSAEAQASRRLHEASLVLEQRWQRLHRLNFAISLGASATFAASTAACLGIGTGAVAGGTMTVGGFVLATVYMLQMVRPLESLGAAARDLSKSLGYLRPLLGLLSLQGSTGASLESTATTAGGRQPPSVRFENLHFGYEPGRPVIKGLDLHVPAGSTTAIVGRSGSGKSSLARLLMGLYAPQQGRILLDGRRLDSIAATELRGSLVGLVPQETALLHESIAGNIALGVPTATRDEIRAAARCAQLQDLVDALPGGLDTPVGERGLQLSGGERQRVGIARALLRRPVLYVLDEPTSMLDSKTDAEIQKALRSTASGATRIVIAHRLSTIVDADEIVVLDDGRIHERGSHQALLAKDGLYARMWRQQTAACP